MNDTVVWSKQGCPFCTKAIDLLNRKGIKHEVRTIGKLWSREQLLEAVPGARTVPQIFLEGKLIGGYTELAIHFADMENK